MRQLCPTALFTCDVRSFWMSCLQSVCEDQEADGLVVRATVPADTTAMLIVPAATAGKPTVTVRGKPRDLESRNGTFACDVGPVPANSR